MSGLHFRSLRLRKMPGFADGGFELRDLCAGINVVFGPNASGKTTTARSLELLLWPGSAPPPEAWIEARFNLTGTTWMAELDAGRSRFWCNGSEVPGPALPAREERSRYLLSLPDLLRADDAGFARAIAKESAGGYDLAEAAEVLAPRATASRADTQRRELRRAKERLQNARAVQERLQRESATLGEKEARLGRRGDLESRCTLLERAAELTSRKTEEREARAWLESFDPVIGRLTGEEPDRLASLRAALAQAKDDETAASRRRAELLESLNESAPPDAALDGTILRALSSTCSDVEEAERRIREEEKRVVESRSRLGGEDSALEASVRITDAQLDALIQAAHALERIRASREALEAELRLLGPEVEVPDVQRLQRASGLLADWLEAATEASGTNRHYRRLGVVSAAAVIIAGVALSLFHPAGWAAIALGAILLLLVFVGSRIPDRRPILQGQFEALGDVADPPSWTRQAVRERLEELSAAIIEAREEERKVDRRARLTASIAACERKADPFRRQFEDAAASAGASSDSDEVQLIWRLERILRRQTARDELDAAAAALENARTRRDELLDRANRWLSRLAVDPVANVASLKARVELLDEQIRTHERLSAELRSVDRSAAAAQQQRQRCEQDLARLFDQLSIAPDDEARVREWAARRDEFLKARDAHGAVLRECQRIEETLRALPGFDESLFAIPETERSDELEAIRAELRALHDLRDEVTRIRTRVDHAKRGHEVEEALEEVEACRADLQSVRERDIRSAIADVLVRHLEHTNRDQHLPGVFHRANELFSRITRGRYSLRLESRGAQSAFLAFDTARERSQPLEQLSSGTRLQLLIAVRAAFVELQERGEKLPLVMDETLANSDEERASAVMDAVLELCSQGRQIFYFTAQPDEVRRWRLALGKQEDVEWRILDLGEIRRLEARLDPDRLELPPDPPTPVPAPAGLDHWSYGRILDVPSIDLHSPIGALHLWYLIEDPDLLWTLLQEFGLERWGHLSALLMNGGQRLFGGDVVARVRAAAAAADLILERLRIGRGRPVDRQALVASGAVSDKFIDQVDALCRELHGDAASLLVQLDSGAVPRFFKKNVEALAIFFEESGHLDPAESLSLDHIRVEVLAGMATAVDEERVSITELDRLLHRLARGAGRQVIHEVATGQATG